MNTQAESLLQVDKGKRYREQKWKVKKNGTRYDNLTNRNVTVYVLSEV